MKKYIVDKAEELVMSWSRGSGCGSECPVNSSIQTCEMLIEKHWKKKWAHWFYNDVNPSRIWTDKEYASVIYVIKNKYKKELEKELLNSKLEFQKLISSNRQVVAD